MKIDVPCVNCIKSDVCGFVQGVSERIGELEGFINDDKPYLHISVNCDYRAVSGAGKNRAETVMPDGITRNMGCGDCENWVYINTTKPTPMGSRAYRFGDCICTEQKKHRNHKPKNRREDMPPCESFQHRRNEGV